MFAYSPYKSRRNITPNRISTLILPISGKTLAGPVYIFHAIYTVTDGYVTSTFCPCRYTVSNTVLAVIQSAYTISTITNTSYT